MKSTPIIFAILLFTACQSDTPQSGYRKVADDSPTVFTELTAGTTGIDFTNQLTPTPALNILEYLYYYNGGGVAVGDLNNDGLEDVFLTANQSADQLYLNKGDLKFKNITVESGIAVANDWSSGVTMDDVNGDGLLDIYVCKVSPVSQNKTHNLLYINQGDLTFKERAADFGLDFSGYSTNASFFDYDGDGDLDVYLLNHSVHSVRSYGKIDQRKVRDDLAGDRLYENQLNEATGKFVEVTTAAGIYSSALGYGLGIVTEDFNQDGKIDIYIGNDFHENDFLYLNNGDKTFTESFNKFFNHSSKFTMGVDAADLNNDSRIDVFTTDMLPFDKEVAMKSGGEDTDQIFRIRDEFGFEDQYARNHLQIQNSNQHYSDIALMTKTYATDWSWSCLLQDFDNNGLKDIFITNGIVKRPNDLDYINYINQQANVIKNGLSEESLATVMKNMPSDPLENVLFRQEIPLRFSELSASFVGSPGFSNGAAYADFDQDGDLDILVNNINQQASLLENKVGNQQNYISFKLVDKISNHSVKNAKIKVRTKNGIKEINLSNTRGYQSASTHQAYVGLGSEDAIDTVQVIWPDATESIFTGLPINQLHILEKKENLPTYRYPEPVANAAKTAPFSKHLENNFDDFNVEKLIPEMLSREGPAVVYADFNQDGIKDLFRGGGQYQAPEIYLGTGKTFKKLENKDFARDTEYEDVDAAAIDFDGDGDLDLYVVSGGGVHKKMSKDLEDRLYLNDGKGNLKRLPLSLPHTNGGSVAVGDFDGDGFEDLFVGSRSMPGYYGLAPFSFILRNKGGFGIEIAKKERYGMITDSKWADYDGDGDLDLILCGDWMPISIIENQGDGNLVYRSKDLGLLNTGGLWNCIYLHDFNGDGKLDILAGNAGENFKWKASPEDPVKLFVGDFDKNDQPEPLIFTSFFGKKMPFAGLDKLKMQVPVIRKQFQTYADFSEVEKIEDLTLYNPERIADQREIRELRSMLFLSDGQGYTGIPLPGIAQWSSIQDFTVTENKEILFIGNHHEYLTEFGKSMGNSGGKFAGFDAEKKTFGKYTSLSLPAGINTRSITPLEVGGYFVAVNNGKGFFIQ